MFVSWIVCCIAWLWKFDQLYPYPYKFSLMVQQMCFFLRLLSFYPLAYSNIQGSRIWLLWSFLTTLNIFFVWTRALKYWGTGDMSPEIIQDFNLWQGKLCLLFVSNSSISCPHLGWRPNNVLLSVCQAVQENLMKLWIWFSRRESNWHAFLLSKPTKFEQLNLL